MPGDVPRAELYVPAHVMPEAWYYGMVRHEGPRGSGSTGSTGGGEDSGGSMTIHLGADPAAVLVPPYVEMPPGADHGIFSFKGLVVEPIRSTHPLAASSSKKQSR